MDVKELFTFALTVFIGYFAVMNPLTKAPVFISLTRGAGIERNTAWRARRALQPF